MSSFKVPPRFKRNFEQWAAEQVASGAYTELDVEEARGIIRQDLTEGEDALRAGLSSETPDRQDRFDLWDKWLCAQLGKQDLCGQAMNRHVLGSRLSPNTWTAVRFGCSMTETPS